MADHLRVEPLRPPSVLGLLRRRWYAILIPLLVLPAAGLALSLLADKKYEAQTSLLFKDSGFGSPVLASEDPQREAATNVRLLQLDVLGDRVQARLGKPTAATAQVTAEADSNLATITVTAEDPRHAARLANLYAEEYIALRRETDRREITQELAAIGAELADLTPEELNTPRGSTLRARERELTLAGTAQSGTRQISPAEPPTSASSPDPVRNMVLGGFVGLILGVALAIALERRDRRIRDPREMEAVFGRPIVGRIPRSRALELSPGTASLPPPETEAFQALRVNLSHLLRERDANTILVTSATPSEGKTTIAWNLARAAAVSGANVLLVEADMRRPVLAQSLGANGAEGLSELLSGTRELPELVQRIGFDAEEDGSPVTADVLLAGTAPSNPAELLDSTRMEAVLGAVPEGYDLVILDTPPASVVSDVMPVLRFVDGVVVVGRLGLTTHDSIVDLRDRLGTLEAPIFGVVVNADVPDVDARGYYQTVSSG